MSTSLLYTYPHNEARVQDKSIYRANYVEEMPLHKPIFFGRAHKGPVGVPIWLGTTNYAKKMLGDGTFDKYSDYYSRESVFLQYCLESQGAFYVRLLSESAKSSSCLLSCHVTPANIPQYEKDTTGQFVLTTSGDKIPLMDGENAVTAPGYKLQWIVSTISESTDISSLTVSTVTDNGVTTQIFPIVAMRSTSPGKWGDDTGFKLDFNYSAMDQEQIARIKAITYMFYPVAKTYGQDTVSAVRTTYGDASVDVAMRPDAIDSRLDKNYSFAKVAEESYWSDTYQVSNLPYSIHVYDTNIKAIATGILGVETDLDITEPFLIDIFTGKTYENLPLDCVEIVKDDTNANNVTISKDYIIYLTGGDDGDIDDESMESLLVQYLGDDVYPEINDSARYPFTHIYDTGYTLNTKKSLIDFLGVRDDFKLILATQDCLSSSMNTKDEDMSVGTSLHSSALLQPESVVFGTGCCRCEIYQQAGPLNDTTRYESFLPFTLNALIKRCNHQSKSYIDGQPKGLPLSRVDVFNVSKVNWFPCKAEHKQDSWSIGLNYAQYYNRTMIHHPDIRTVYYEDTSVLSSAIFTDIVVYAKHIIRYNWAYHAGKELAFDTLAAQAKSTTLADMQQMLNGYCGAELRFYRTDEEEKLGYVAHSELKLTGNASNRVWINDIICYRSDYEAEEA